MIERFLKGEPLDRPCSPRLPQVYVEPLLDEAALKARRAETPRAPAEWRKRNFAEVEVSLSQAEASQESLRCLRCDLEFTSRRGEPAEDPEAGRQSA